MLMAFGNDIRVESGTDSPLGIRPTMPSLVLELLDSSLRILPLGVCASHQSETLRRIGPNSSIFGVH